MSQGDGVLVKQDLEYWLLNIQIMTVSLTSPITKPEVWLYLLFAKLLVHTLTLFYILVSFNYGLCESLLGCKNLLHSQYCCQSDHQLQVGNCWHSIILFFPICGDISSKPFYHNSDTKLKCAPSKCNVVGRYERSAQVFPDSTQLDASCQGAPSCT